MTRNSGFLLEVKRNVARKHPFESFDIRCPNSWGKALSCL